MSESFNFNADANNPEVNDRIPGQQDNVLDLDSMGKDDDPIVKVVANRVERPNNVESMMVDRVSQEQKEVLPSAFKKAQLGLFAAFALMTGFGCSGYNIEVKHEGPTLGQGIQSLVMEGAKTLDAANNQIRRNPPTQTVYDDHYQSNFSGGGQITPEGARGSINFNESASKYENRGNHFFDIGQKLFPDKKKK